MASELVHVGFHSFLAVNRITEVLSTDSVSCKRVIREAKNTGGILDMTSGRHAKVAILLDSGHIVLAATVPQPIQRWLATSGTFGFEINAGKKISEQVDRHADPDDNTQALS